MFTEIKFMSYSCVALLLFVVVVVFADIQQLVVYVVTLTETSTSVSTFKLDQTLKQTTREMFGGKKQSSDSGGSTFQVGVVRSADGKVFQKGTLEVTPTSIMYRGADGSKTKLSWTLKSVRKMETNSDKTFVLDTGDPSCILSEGGVVHFQMANAKTLLNVVIRHMKAMNKAETASQHYRGSMTDPTSSFLQAMTQADVMATTAPSDETPTPFHPPPTHWRLNTRTSVESTSSNVSPTNSRASSVQREIFEVSRIVVGEPGGRREEHGVLEVMENEIIFVETESVENRRVVWPFKFIRRFGHEGDIFTVEVGRKAPGGEGLHHFRTTQSSELNAAIKASSVGVAGGGGGGVNMPPSSHPVDNFRPHPPVHGHSSFTPPSQRRPGFNPNHAAFTHHPPPVRAAPLPPPPTQPPLPIPPSPPQVHRSNNVHRQANASSSRNLFKQSSNEGGGFQRSDSLIRRAFSAADLRQNVFEVKNISDDKKEVGQGTLEVTATDLIYIDAHTSEKWRWPFKFLRKYGYERNIFSFEAGRRCPGGQGLYAFSSERASEIHETIEENIHGKKPAPPQHQHQPQQQSLQARASHGEENGQGPSHKHVAQTSSASSNVRTQRAVAVPKSRNSFSEDQIPTPSSLVKLTNKNHYTDNNLHALMQTRPLPAEPGEEAGTRQPSLAMSSHSGTHKPADSLQNARKAPSTPPMEKMSKQKSASPPPSMSHSAPPLPGSATPPLDSAPPLPGSAPPTGQGVPPPMQLVKPVLPNPSIQPIVREHHYDVPANYAANSKSGKKSKKETSSDSSKGKRASGAGVAGSHKSASSKKKFSKQSSKAASTSSQVASLQVGVASTKDPRGQFNLRSLLKKRKPAKRDSINAFESSHLGYSGGRGEGMNGGEELCSRGTYVNVKVDSLRRMKKSASCDDLLSSNDYGQDTPSAVPTPQLYTSSQTPPIRRRGYANDDGVLETGSHDPLPPSAASLVYQNLQDIKSRGERSHSHPVTPSFAPEEGGGTQRTSVTPDRLHLYTNVTIIPEAEPVQRTAYTEVEIRQTSPSRGDDQQILPTPPGGSRTAVPKEMPPFLQKALQKKTSPGISPGVSPRASPKLAPRFKDRSQSFMQVSDEMAERESRHRSQSEALWVDGVGREGVAVMDCAMDTRQKFAQVQYAPLDFAAMDAVAELKRGHNDIRNFDELLGRHDIREMEMEGKRR